MKKYIIPIITVLAFAAALVITVTRDKSPATTRAAEYQIYSPLKVYGYMALNPVISLPATPGTMWIVNHNDTLKYYGEDEQWHSLLVAEALGDSSWTQVVVDSIKAQSNSIGLKFVIDNTYPGTTLYPLGSTYKFLMLNHPGMIRLADLPNVTYDYGTAAYATKGTLFQPYDRDSLYYYNGTVWQALNKLGSGTGGGLSEPLNLSQPITSTSSTPYISKISGTKSFTFHHHGTEDLFILAPSESDNGTDWDWANQFTFDATGSFQSNNIGVGIYPTFTFHVQKSVSADVVGFFNNTSATGNGIAIRNGNDNNYALSIENTAGVQKIRMFGNGNITSSTIISGGNKFTVNNPSDSATVEVFAEDEYNYVTAIKIDSASNAGITISNSNEGVMVLNSPGHGLYAENTEVGGYASQPINYGFWSEGAGVYNFFVTDIFGVDNDSIYALYLTRETNDKMFAVVTPSGAFDTAWLDPMAIGLIDALLDPEAWLADTLNGEGKWVYMENGKRFEVYGLPKGINSIEALQYMTEMLLRMSAEHYQRFRELEHKIDSLSAVVSNITTQDKTIIKNPFKKVNALIFLIGQFLLVAIGLSCYLIGRRK